MRAWIIRVALVHFALATHTPGNNISESLTGSTNKSHGGSSTTATSTATTSSLPANVTSVPSGPSTQAQSIIPIKPTSFSPFSVPSDVPIPPNYPALDPSQPPSVSYTRSSFWQGASILLPFVRLKELLFPQLSQLSPPVYCTAINWQYGARLSTSTTVEDSHFAQVFFFFFLFPIAVTVFNWSWLFLHQGYR